MKTFYKIENNQIIKAPKNGLFNGSIWSNLDLYLDANPDIANGNGYYELDESTTVPDLEDSYILATTYEVKNNKIITNYEVHKIH